MEQNEIYAALPGVLLPWYEKNARDLPWRHTKEPYRVWVSEIMLQQTRVEAVIGYYERFMEAFPTVQALAEADEARVLKLWKDSAITPAHEICRKRQSSSPKRKTALFPILPKRSKSCRASARIRLAQWRPFALSSPRLWMATTCCA